MRSTAFLSFAFLASLGLAIPVAKPAPNPSMGVAVIAPMIRSPDEGATKRDEGLNAYAPPQYNAKRDEEPNAYNPAQYVAKRDQEPNAYNPAQYVSKRDEEPNAYNPAQYVA